MIWWFYNLWDMPYLFKFFSGIWVMKSREIMVYPAALLVVAMQCWLAVPQGLRLVLTMAWSDICSGTRGNAGRVLHRHMSSPLFSACFDNLLGNNLGFMLLQRHAGRQEAT